MKTGTTEYTITITRQEAETIDTALHTYYKATKTELEQKDIEKQIIRDTLQDIKDLRNAFAILHGAQYFGD